ncbi:hypothetical protein [Allokutzneria oryzae]|uniref:ATP-grasp domain-containing protein n=1 Tax=Allokutzneria oryzae TaxID=1378989 RepID=A0ABV5ZXC8_9PSEU
MNSSFKAAAQVGPIAPMPGRTTLYALDAEESSVTEPEEKFSDRTVRIDGEYTRSNSAYAISVLPATEKDDIFILDEAYRSQTWLIDWLRKVYRVLGIEFAERIHFATPKNFAATSVPLLEQDSAVAAVSTICYSYNLCKTFPVEQHTRTSGYLNAKTSFPDLAKKYSFDIPKSVVTAVRHLRAVAVSEFGFPTVPVYVKMDGLGGGYNVARVVNDRDLDLVLDSYAADQHCVIQEAVDSSYFETIHLYTLADSGIEYQGSRVKITTDGQWYGNIFLPELRLTERQRRTADAAAYAAWHGGYRAREPLLIGLDGFMNGDELLITEFNARWLGSSPAEYIMKRLGIYNKVAALSVFDYVAEGEVQLFMDWVEKNLYRSGEQPARDFMLLPMGIGGYPEENSSRLVNFIIFGDAHACEKDVRKTFSDDSFTLLNNSVSTLDDVLAKGLPQ